jgi:hypothetical protein
LSFSSVSTDIKSFVRFNGTTNFSGDCSIDSSKNVSSVTDLGTGEYRVNFTTAITDTNYSAVGSAQSRSIGNDAGYATGSMTIQSRRTDDFALADSPAVNLVIFR